MKIVGLVGRKWSGKTSAARHLEANHPGLVHRDSLASPIKEYVVNIFGPLEETPKPVLRPVMQSLGEALKQKFGNEIFLNMLKDRIELDAPQSDLVVIDDIRFPFEADWVRSSGGTVVRIIRPSTDDSGDGHTSETSVDRVAPHITLINDASEESFLTKVTNTLLL